MWRRGSFTALLLASAVAGCGGSDEATTDQPAARSADLAAVKTFLLDHTEQLQGEVTTLRENAEAYYALAEQAGFDYDRLLSEQRAEVRRLVDRSQKAFGRANPAYEEMEGVVAGVPVARRLRRDHRRRRRRLGSRERRPVQPPRRRTGAASSSRATSTT